MSAATTAPSAAGLDVRLAAAARLREVLGGARFTPLSAAEIADGRDRALANRLVTVALRRHGHLDIAISRLLDRGLPKKSGNFEPVLRLSLAQLLFLPELKAHSAVFLAVEALRADPKSRHLAGLMNAVLRRAQAEAAALTDLPVELLLPDVLRLRWQSWYGPEAMSRLASALRDGAALDLTFKDVGDMAGLGAGPVLAETGRLLVRDRLVEQLEGYAEGRWWVQDAAAAIPARLLQLPPGSRVLDACAAPGGKTAQLCQAGYRVTALDNDSGRLARLETNLARLGFAPEIVLADAGRYRPAERYDGVLLDAPCSATGTFRRHPEVLWHRDAADIAGRVTVQQALLRNVVDCLNPGGVLLYCVCSMEREEGEDQARWALDSLPLEPFPVRAGDTPLPAGALSPEGQVRTHAGLAPGVTALVGDKPAGLDGFFIARFRRR